MLTDFFTKGLPVAISGMFDEYKNRMSTEEDTTKKQEATADFKKAIKLAMINCFSAIRADQIRALDGKTEAT